MFLLVSKKAKQHAAKHVYSGKYPYTMSCNHGVKEHTSNNRKGLNEKNNRLF